MRTLSYIFTLGFILSGCSSIKQFDIETQNPAQITFPRSVRTVLMVNNAASQPDDRGYSLNIFGKNQDTLRIKADTALVTLCRSLGKSLAESPYFDDVLLYDEKTRDNDEFLVDQKLTQEQVESLCEQNGADAIISIDRMLFGLDETVKNFISGQTDVAATATGYLKGTIRSYIPGRKSPLASVIVEDSVKIQDFFIDINSMKKYFPSPQETIIITADEIGSRLTPNFIPYWQNERRWIYSGLSSKWKEASAYASADNWGKASNLWKSIFEKSDNIQTKAKAASNIALCYEMETKLDEAAEWATKSEELFTRSKGKDDKYSILQKAYLQALKERISSNAKLNMQFSR